MRFSDARLDRAATAWEEESERWIFRRRMDKSGFEAVRLDDAGVISDDAMEVTQLGASDADARLAFNSMRRRACARAALLAGRNARS